MPTYTEAASALKVSVNNMHALAKINGKTTRTTGYRVVTDAELDPARPEFLDFEQWAIREHFGEIPRFLRRCHEFFEIDPINANADIIYHDDPTDNWSSSFQSICNDFDLCDERGPDINIGADEVAKFKELFDELPAVRPRSDAVVDQLNQSNPADLIVDVNPSDNFNGEEQVHEQGNALALGSALNEAHPNLDVHAGAELRGGAL